MKKRILSVFLAMIFIFSVGGNVFASSYSGYHGDNYYNTSFNNYYGSYYMSPWFEDLRDAYEPTWYENPQRQVVRGEAFLLFLRAVQKSLDRQGYSRLMSGFSRVPFSDYDTINPYAQSEVNVLYANNILVGFDDNTMRFSQGLTRAELAAIYARFNRIYFNMGPGYNQWNYDGYNDYYNNNFNNYYNNYMFHDITGHWAAQDIITAASNGVMNGVGNGYFDTNSPLTIEQIWKVLDNCVGYQGLKRSDIAYAMSQTFKVKFGKNIDESSGTISGTKITRLSASPSTVSIVEGKTQTIKVNITPTKASYQKLQWSFENYSDSNYATIQEAWNSSSGIAYVRIYGKRTKSSYMNLIGRAMDGSGKSVTVRVRITEDYDYDYDYDYDEEYISSITPSDDTIYLDVGQSVEVNARIRPSDADYKVLRWTSENTNVADVSDVYLSGSYSNATITAYREGTTYINIKAQDGSGENATMKVVVDGGSSTNSIVTSAVANPSYINMKVGNSQNVAITLYPTNAYDKDVTWISNNENVARVDKISNTSIRITTVGVGNASVIGIAIATGKQICVIPVTVSPNDSSDIYEPIDYEEPVVKCYDSIMKYEGETGYITITAHDDNLKTFDISDSDIIVEKNYIRITDIKKISNDTIEVHYKALKSCSGELTIASGVAVDKSGNTSRESAGVRVLINVVE